MKSFPFLRFLTLAALVFSTAISFAADPDAPVAVKADAKVKLAAVGDSITAGHGTKNHATDSYPTQLNFMLGDKWEVKNFGVSGATLLNGGDKPYQKQKAFQQALDLNPDVVVIALGTNDTKPKNWDKKTDFVADYKELIGKLKKLASNPRIFICYPPFVVKDGAFGINEAGVLEQIPMIDQIAKEESVGIIDIHGALKDKPDLSKDKVHPNFQGATAMAGTVYKKLTGKAYSGPAPEPGVPPAPKEKKPIATPSPSNVPVPAL